MIPNYNNREIESSGVEASASFGISLKDSAHIMTILRDTLYSDKVLAVLREYSANAWDAHRMVGKLDLPIKITLPTVAEPTLTIKDYGPGIAHDDVFQVYTQYGASTKRGSDVSVGMLGIGSKSGFAYSDSFTIASSYGGMRRTYVAVLDETEEGKCNLLYQEECGEETGISIQIPIKPEDIWEFTTKAQKLFKYFNPRPDINCTLPPKPDEVMSLAHGAIWLDESAGEWVAVMGCIPYHVNLEQLTGRHIPGGGIGEHVQRISGALYFNIGEVQISASREELKYNTTTKTAMVKKFNALVDEFVTNTLKALDTADFTIWEKRVRAQTLGKLGLPIPAACKELVKDSVRLPDDFPKTFTVHHAKSNQIVTHINVSTSTRLLIVDDSRWIPGFSLANVDYLIRAKAEPVLEGEKLINIEWSLEEVLAELLKYVDLAGIKGINIDYLSTVSWFKPPPKRGYSKTTNDKHYLKRFKLNSSNHWGHPWSRAWDAADSKRKPTDKDVFVILKDFRTDGTIDSANSTGTVNFDIYHEYRRDAELAKEFSYTMPEVYGYKKTKAKPIETKDCIGITYQEWRKTFIKELQTKKVSKELNQMAWDNIIDINHRGQKKVDELVEALGKQHLLVQFVKKHLKAEKAYAKLTYNRRDAIHKLGNRIFDKNVATRSEAQVAKDAIYERYPLLGLPAVQLDELWNENYATQWREYVQLIDRVIPMGLMTFTPVSDDDTESDEDDDD